jgi:hypothetical protein
MVFFVDTEQGSLRMLKVFHVPADNTLLLQDERFQGLGDVAIVDDTLFMLDTVASSVWVVDVKAAVSGSVSAVHDDDSGETDDANHGGASQAGTGRKKTQPKLIASPLRMVGQTARSNQSVVEEDLTTSLRCPVAVCVSMRSSRSFDLLITTRAADNKGGNLWQLSFDKADPLVAVGTSLCHCSGLPAGVAALSDMQVAVIVGRSLCIWTYQAGHGYNGTLSVVMETVGVMPCGLYSLPLGVATDEAASCAMYVLDEGRNSITEVWKVNDREWESKVIMGGLETGSATSTTMGTASAIGLNKPTFGCFVHKAFLFAESGCQCIRMLTDAYPHAELLIPILRIFAEAFQLMEPSYEGDDDSSDDEETDDGEAHFDLGASDDEDARGDYERRNMHHNAANLLQTVAKLHQVDIFLNKMGKALVQATGNTAASLQGPSGHFSRSVRCAIRSALIVLPRLLSRLLSEVGIYIIYSRLCVVVVVVVVVVVMGWWWCSWWW